MSKQILILILMFVFIQYSDSAGAELTVTANHSHINIDWDYHGSSVSLKGKTDPDVELIAVLSSENISQSLKKKDKVGGILWMNTGDVHFDNLPEVYFLHSSKTPDDILPKEEMKRYGIGYEALLNNADITPSSDDSDKKNIFNDFVSYKQDANLYAESVGDFAITNDEGGHYYTKVKWPYQVQPGKYKAKVYAVKNKTVVDQAEAEVDVELSGIVANLTDVARNNGALYGIMAIITAIATGFGAGLIFKKSGGAH